MSEHYPVHTEDWHPKTSEDPTLITVVLEGAGGEPLALEITADDAELIQAWLDPNDPFVQSVAEQLSKKNV